MRPIKTTNENRWRFENLGENKIRVIRDRIVILMILYYSHCIPDEWSEVSRGFGKLLSRIPVFGGTSQSQGAWKCVFVYLWISIHNFVYLCICEIVYEFVYYKGFGKLLSRIPVPGGTSQSQGVRPLGHLHPLGGGVIGLGHVEPLQMSQSISLRKSSKLPHHPAGEVDHWW